ncbi:MAG: LpxI family protein [Caulobacteraceae bacterium]
MAGKLGIVAGGGSLPIEIAQACEAAGRPFFAVRLKGMTDAGMADFPGEDIEIARLGAVIEAFKREGCEAICLAGNVKRPDFKSLKPDFYGVKALPGILAAARKGDDALLRELLRLFEKEGFRIEGADAAAGDIVLTEGPQGTFNPRDLHLADIQLGIEAARQLGNLDIGQAVVVCGGLVLAVEAQEGTGAMLDRCAHLPEAIRGTVEARRGVLVKLAKPSQDLRVDLPTIGLQTVEAASKAGLAGIVGEAGGMLIVGRREVVEAADRHGLFLYGEPSRRR